jgi:RNA polymerase sigma factor (sigma-70 family)
MVTAADETRASDEQLMSALQRGDDTALGQLMARWELPLKRFLLRLGADSAAVEDLAQEAFVRIYQQRARYRPALRFKPWLLTLAGNLARNAARWKRRHPAESLDQLSAADPASAAWKDAAAPRPDQNASAANLAEAVRGAVMQLPVNLREAVVLVEIEDLSYAEAAEALGCSVKSVETRLYRARNALRESLRGIEPEFGSLGVSRPER